MKLLKKPIFVSISPNAQADDVWLALKLIFQPWKWKRGKCVEKFERMLEEYLCYEEKTSPQPPPYQGGGAILFESGRTALYAILMALGIKQGDEVLVQAFTCTAAVNPILWAGAKPVYVDIEGGTYNMSPDDLEKKITPKSKVVIMQHTFGFPVKINEIMEIAEKHNLIVLEDCAHSLGAGCNGQKVGTFGEASFFSFGRSKVISSVFGGAAFTKNPELAEKIREIHNKWQYPSRRWIAQQLFHPIYLAIAKLFYNFLGIGKMMIVIGKKLRLISIMVYSIEKSGGKPPFGPAKMPNALACLGVNQMRKIERFNEYRRRIAEFYRTQLSFLRKQESTVWVDNGDMDSRFRGNDKVDQDGESYKAIFLNFPVQVKSFGIRWKLIGRARKQGIYLESWPAKDKKVVGPDNVNLEKLYYTEGTCPNAEKTAQISINLPTNPNTTINDVKRVVKFLKSFWQTK